MGYLAETRRTAGEALRLREWALGRLLRGVAGSPAPQASAGGWRLFLAIESCAALLHQAVAGDAAPMDPAGASVLRAAALDDTTRALSARAQLRLLARLAGELGIEVIVLKGGADLARGMELRVADVDVLVRPEELTRLAEALDAGGLVPQKQDGFWHLQPRTAEGALQVEIHRAVTGFDAPELVPWGETAPLPGFEPLRALAPPDHAWTVLNQAVRNHPARRTRIRDLVMVRRALEACTPPQRADLDARVGAGDPAYRAMVRLAEEGGRVEGEAARRLRREYLLRSRVPRVPEAPTLATMWVVAIDTAAIGGLSNRRRLVAARQAIGRRGWSAMRAVRECGLLLTTLGVKLLTLDGPLLTRQDQRER